MQKLSQKKTIRCKISYCVMQNAHTYMPSLQWLLPWHTQITVYTHVNKISTDINRNTVQKLRILRVPAVNQRIQRKVTTQALHNA
jgi:hypothetical protein